MTEEEKKIEERVMAWRFGFFVVFSLFLIVTFVFYLPLRFVHNVGEEEEMHGIAPGGGQGGGASQYHEEGDIREGLAVNLNVTPVPVLTGTSTRLDFFVNEKPGNVPVRTGELEIEHEKLMHVIGVRNDMNEFFHIHPQPTTTPGILSADHAFGKPGAYKIWSEIKKDGVNHSFGHPEFAVQGPGPTFEKQVSFGRNVIVGAYQVSLALDEPVVKSHEHDLTFDIHTLTGREVGVEPYLGAAMHLTIIKDDWKQFIHTHPETEGGDHHGLGILPFAKAHTEEGSAESVREDEAVNFHVIFPEAGLYKAFAQFRPAGIDLPPDEALTVSFWIQVEDKAPAAIPDKVLYTAISLMLIVLFSWGVRRYLQGVNR